MKRFHVHVAVDDLAALFGVPPSVAKPDYAKWMLDDPRVNFAISRRGRAAGLEHLGIQVDDRSELGALHARLESAGETVADKGAATCCYAKSEKGWVRDPAGLSWETFFTRGEGRLLRRRGEAGRRDAGGRAGRRRAVLRRERLRLPVLRVSAR
jgi:hypothetical protein